MIDRQKTAGPLPPQPPPAPASLPYAIEVWDAARNRPERVIGRAASMVLARAIFAAARTEHLGRKVVLRRGSRVVAEAG